MPITATLYSLMTLSRLKQTDQQKSRLIKRLFCASKNCNNLQQRGKRLLHIEPEM